MLFQYTSIDRSTIRLIRFLPYSTPSNIYLSLEHLPYYYHHQQHPPHPSLKYNALKISPPPPPSQPEEDRKPLTLAGRTFLVPSPLWDALSSMVDRKFELATPLWAEYVCVNQQDEDEKYVQEAQKGRILRCARKVLVWNGVAVEEEEEEEEHL
ncbi:Hypothetical predicted protein [Lecanosticta acicola]|uniref:Heterokaryon incompatibility domain-containing protein n=1 Tax=Lecanosticta acicola TaxID=111012 RepID=A0AAI8YXQ3_9PEZI|nr:Hypothetical predicted protein [Lecanosticta acicola]